MIRILLALLLASSLSWPAVAQAKDDPRLKFIGKLIHTSSAAKQVKASGIASAMSKHAEADKLYNEAVLAGKVGDSKESTRLLNLASKTMFQAVRLAKSDEVLKKKKKRDYESREESIRALLDAQKRVSEEKNVGDSAEEVRVKIGIHMDQAKNLYDQQKYAEGRKVLDKAYNLLKISIESLRGGDTLVRDLNFETPEDEYHYEVDRNDTHQMLVKVLLKDKKPRPRAMDRIKKYIAESKVLRAAAEEQAGAGQFEEAIKTLENSTKSLVRAIRSAGVFIPG